MKTSPIDTAKRMSVPSSSGLPVTLEKIGVTRFDLDDPYHLALTLTWPQFFAGLLAVYLLINFVFAVLYFLAPGSVVNLPAGSLVDAFFFSVETLATVGYGNMAPVSLYGHIVSTIEIFISMILTATMTGLVFVRFSKPKAKILFASKAVVSRRGGETLLMIRIGNGRMNALTETSVRLTTLATETTNSGQQFRSLVDVTLQRAHMPYFPLTWTIIHKVTDDSPFAALQTASDETVHATGLRFALSVTARDPSLGATVYATQAYSPGDFALDMRYADAVSGISDHHSVADMRKLSDVIPDV